MQKFFVTGTDTGVGKTFISCALLQACNQRGLKTIGLKPIAAGCEQTAEGLRNDDALRLQQAMSVALSYDQVNPIALEPAIAPHIALSQLQKRVTASQLSGFCQGAFCAEADLALVEGAGGWRVPLNQRETLADLAIELQLPVILVVGMRLGCINHALLSTQAILHDKLPLAGWVANQVDPSMAFFDENVASIEDRMPAPLLGIVPHLTDPAQAASLMRVDALLS